MMCLAWAALRLPSPTAGVARAGRPTYCRATDLRPSTSSWEAWASTHCHAPALAGSSCAQNSLLAFGNLASCSSTMAAGKGASSSSRTSAVLTPLGSASSRAFCRS